MNRRASIHGAASLFIFLITTAPLPAATFDWAGAPAPSAESFNNASNWTPAGGPPSAADIARFNLVQNSVVVFSTDVTNTSLRLLAGQTTLQPLDTAATDSRTYTVTDNSFLNGGDLALVANSPDSFDLVAQRSFFVGGNAAAPGSASTLDLQFRGSLSVLGTTRVWGPGTLNLTDGILTTGSFRNQGVFNHAGGILIINGGQFDHGAPDLVLDRPTPITTQTNPELAFVNGSETSVTGTVTVGDFLGGRLELTSGSTLSHDGSAFIGDETTGDGFVAVSGSTWTIGTGAAVGGLELVVGRFGHGTLT